MTPQFLVAGVLALAGAAIHGGAGELLVLRRLAELPSTLFGGAAATRVMIRFSWHAVTFVFAAAGSALATCGVLGPGTGCRGIGMGAAITFTGFLALAVALAPLVPRMLLRHPGPPMFLTVAALSWWGAA